MKRIISVALFAVSFSASVACADAMLYNSAGVGSGSAESDIHAVSETEMFIGSVTTYENIAMEDPAHPFNGMQGKCFGAIEMNVPGASGSGNCVFKDGDGDMTVNRYHISGMAADGTLTGTWSVVSGTGKFAGSTGGGHFHSLTDREAGTFENRITGAVMLK